jgi:hypothetical protein
MDRLQADLRIIYDGEVDPLTVRRLKARVLEQADARVSGRVRARGPWAMALGGAAAALFIAGASLLWLPARQPVDMREEGPARFTATTDGNVERVELEEGRLRIAVRDPRHRVHVAVPDGEIEDLGTVFHVTVAGGHTEQVDVEEGRVLLRLRGEPEQTLVAGQRWVRTPPDLAARAPARLEAPASEAPASEAPASEAPASDAPASDPAPSLAAAPAPRLAQRPSRPGPSLEPTKGASLSSPVPAAAQAAAPAPELPAPVLPSPPPDAEVEDAAYVKLVALLRAGEVEAARLAARQYLRDFPNGFRREEVGRISRALPLTRPER